MLNPNNQSKLTVFEHELDVRQRKHLNETRKNVHTNGFRAKIATIMIGRNFVLFK